MLKNFNNETSRTRNLANSMVEVSETSILELKEGYSQRDFQTPPKIMIRYDLNYYRDRPQNSIHEQMKLHNLNSAKSVPFLSWLVYIKPLIFLIFAVLCSIVLGYFALKKHNSTIADDYHSAARVLNYARENLEIAPIQNIKFVPFSEQCPLGWQKEKEPFYRFPGVNKGCVCLKNGELEASPSSKCHKHGELKDECYSINSIPAKNLTVFNGITMCVKRLQLWTSISNTSSCPEWMKKCGSRLCVPNADICPIIRLNRHIETLRRGLVNPKEKEVLVVNNRFKVEVERLEVGQTEPLIQFDGHFGPQYSKTCYDRGLTPKPQYSKVFPPFGESQRGCGKFGENFFSKAMYNFDINLKQFLDENQVVPENEQLNYFYQKGIDSREKVFIYAVNRIQMSTDKNQCQFIDENHVKGAGLITYYVEQFHGILKIVLPVALALSIGIAILAIVTEFICVEILKEKPSIFFFIMIMCFSISSLFIALGSYFIYLKSNHIQPHIDYFENFLSKSCWGNYSKEFSNAMQQVIYYVNARFDSYQSFLMAIFVVSLLYIILLLGSCIIAKVRRRPLLEIPV